MYLGIVKGTVVAEQKAEGLRGCKLMLVLPVDDEGRATGPHQVAVDTVQAGVGDHVYLVGSREAALALDPWFVPVDAAIVGIVDDVHNPERAGARSPERAGARSRGRAQPHARRGTRSRRAVRYCRVIGNVTATVKHAAFKGQRLMLVQPLDDAGADRGDTFIAVDHVQAGPGDRVIVLTEGNGARQLLKQGDVVPIRSIVVGVVDAVDIDAGHASSAS